MDVFSTARIMRVTLVAFALWSSCAAGLQAARVGPSTPALAAERNPSTQPVPPLNVHIEQAVGQSDPTNTQPIEFRVVFDHAIDPSSFDASDIIQLGSASGIDWQIVPSGDDRNFMLRAVAVQHNGTLVPSLGPAAVASGFGMSLPSSSNDNSVLLLPVPCSSGVHLYVGIWSPAVLYTYCAHPTGLLELQDFRSAPGDVGDLEVTGDAGSLYYASIDLTAYAIAADGGLIVSGSVDPGNGNFDDIALEPGGAYLYATHSDGTPNGGKLLVYDLFSEPLPVQIQAVMGLISPHGVAVHPSNLLVYVANQSSFLTDPPDAEEIGIFERDLATGVVDVASYHYTSWGAQPDFFAVHPLGEALYSTEFIGGGLVVAHSAGANLTQAADSPIYSGSGAAYPLLSASGEMLYVANSLSDDLSVFAVEPTGEVTLLQVVATARRPQHLLLHPSGDYLYVASAGYFTGSSTLAVYSVDAAGLLTLMAEENIPNEGAYRLAIADLRPPAGGSVSESQPALPVTSSRSKLQAD